MRIIGCRISFENICFKHSKNIKQAMGISGVYSEESSYLYKGDDTNDGLQIDLLIDRQDGIINICEIKFYAGEFSIDKSYATALRNKINVFKIQTETKKSVLLTFISTFGVKQNIHSIGLVDNNLKLSAFFSNIE